MIQIEEILDNLVSQTTEIHGTTQTYNTLTDSLIQQMNDICEKVDPKEIKSQTKKKEMDQKTNHRNTNEQDLEIDLREYQKSLDLIMHKHRELLESNKNKHKSEIEQYSLKLEKLKEDNTLLKQDNQYLRKNIQGIVKVMKQISEIPDEELNKSMSEISQLKKQNKILRDLLQIPQNENPKNGKKN
ncbi:fgfr1 oncogene partner 2 [Anaeramoeba flamelloides]|uniref:Fgfr1 oncogene partner 2 n=1 Tax=Anaeramoeba flamelloides TaxID=1746091 RepID=A0ABQ8YPT3_9EUKA|nr:fgfr1 oncogene partner 2 [Anaeramoeba flamelloides]